MPIPTLNRCQYMYADDRQCRNVICGPGLPYCRPHTGKVAKDMQRCALDPPAPPPHAADDVHTRWLTEHPLDSASNISLALQQVAILVAAGCISHRRAQLHIAVLRTHLKTFREVRCETQQPDILCRHQATTRQSLAQVCEALLPAIQSDQASRDAAFVAMASAAEPEPHPNNSFVPPEGPAPTIDDYVRNQREFAAGVNWDSPRPYPTPVAPASSPGSCRKPRSAIARRFLGFAPNAAFRICASGSGTSAAPGAVTRHRPASSIAFHNSHPSSFAALQSALSRAFNRS